MKRLLGLVTLMIASALLSASPSVADTGSVDDAQDTEDVMDIAQASHGHSSSIPKVLTQSISTFEPWTNDQFLGAEILFWLHDGDRQADRALAIYTNPDDSLAGAVHSIIGGTGCGRATGYCEYGSLRGYANVYRSDAKSLVAEFPEPLLRRRLPKFRWKAFLTWPCHPPEGAVCAPPPPDTHKGRVLHDLTL